MSHNLKSFEIAWANRNSLDYKAVAKLLRLINRAAEAQELEHNERDAPDSEPQLRAVEVHALSMGFDGIKWPGLYPTFIMDGKTVYLP